MDILIFSFVMAPPKSICISSLGSEQFNKGFHFFAGTTGLRFLPISVQGLHWAALFRISQCIYGQNAYCPRVIIPQLPGCLRWRLSSTASRMECGIALRRSTHTQPDRTCKSLQYENKYGFTSLHRCGSFGKMQSRTSLRISLSISSFLTGEDGQESLSKQLR